jgi:glycerophosphoryl diester phosphodiesterase
MVRFTGRIFLGLLFAAAAPAAVGAESPALPPGGICAHRGGSATHPENTLPAFAEAVRLRVPMIELDLALSRDGVLVLMHDVTVDRTTDGRGKVLDLTLAELKRLDAGAWKHPRFAGTRVPTFEEALAALPRDIWLNIDFKSDARWGGRAADAARQAATLLVAAGRIRQALFAARRSEAAAARGVAPDLRICSMDRTPDPADYVRAAIDQRADFIQLRDCARDSRLPEWIAALKAAGVRINYFYANEPAAARHLFAAGVDFVLVDNVAPMLASVLER